MKTPLIDGVGLILPSNIGIAVVAPVNYQDGSTTKRHNLPTEFFYMTTEHGDPSITIHKHLAKVFKNKHAAKISVKLLSEKTGVVYQLWAFTSEFNDASIEFDDMLNSLQDM